MTLQEAKTQIAKKYGYPDWESIDWYQVDYSLSESETKGHAQDLLNDEASMLYAESKWNECTEKNREELAFLFANAGGTLGAYFVFKNLPKPNFKP